METSEIKNPNPNPNSHSSHSHSPSFLFHNGFGSEIEIADIEMITIQTVTYTSLRDLLPASPPTIMSTTHNSSWDEIPIKNPLVKHAALAYLQPMSTPPEVDNKGLFRMIREKCLCCGGANGLGCFAWLCDFVLRTIRDVFGGACCTNEFETGGDEDDEEDDDDDDDGYLKVD